jgi:hypothetical protein
MLICFDSKLVCNSCPVLLPVQNPLLFFPIVMLLCTRSRALQPRPLRTQAKGFPELPRIQRPPKDINVPRQCAHTCFEHQFADPPGLRAPCPVIVVPWLFKGPWGLGRYRSRRSGSGAPSGSEVPPVIDASVGEEPALARGFGRVRVHGEDGTGDIVPVDHVDASLRNRIERSTSDRYIYSQRCPRNIYVTDLGLESLFGRHHPPHPVPHQLCTAPQTGKV